MFGGAGAPRRQLRLLAQQGSGPKSASNLHPHALDADGVETTGLGSVDFWIGGLAAARYARSAKLLGSTLTPSFSGPSSECANNDAGSTACRDTPGRTFLTSLENNTFADMIMANTDATHLPGDVFKTPNYILGSTEDERAVPGAGPPGAAGPPEPAPRSARRARSPRHGAARPPTISGYMVT